MTINTFSDLIITLQQTEQQQLVDLHHLDATTLFFHADDDEASAINSLSDDDSTITSLDSQDSFDDFDFAWHDVDSPASRTSTNSGRRTARERRPSRERLEQLRERVESRLRQLDQLPTSTAAAEIASGSRLMNRHRRRNTDASAGSLDQFYQHHHDVEEQETFFMISPQRDDDDSLRLNLRRLPRTTRGQRMSCVPILSEHNADICKQEVSGLSSEVYILDLND